MLDGFDLDLPDRHATALIGPNGIGKSTVARLLLGLLTPDAGTVEGLTGLSRAAVFQEDRLLDQLTGVANVRFVLGRDYPTTRIEDELAAIGLDRTALHQPVGTLSGGQRRRVALARALLTGAAFLLLDEPLRGIDAQTHDEVLTHLIDSSRGRTVLLITHDETEAAAFGARIVRMGERPS